MTTSTSDRAYDGIRKMLAQGEFDPGQRISQSKLARQLGCSTVPVVEAMRRLESDGLLVKRARKMAKVRELSHADLEGLYLLREGLEAITARLAAQRITDDQAAELQELSEGYESAWEDEPLEVEADVAIHRHIAACAGCPLLSDELDRLMLIERTAGRATRDSKARLGHVHNHRALVKAIIDRDVDSAEYLMKKHIQNGYREAMSELETGRVTQ
jgi:DNA-binding GntR family transcriptional regulator